MYIYLNKIRLKKENKKTKQKKKKKKKKNGKKNVMKKERCKVRFNYLRYICVIVLPFADDIAILGKSPHD